MNTQSHNYCVILAGGIGRRLWPVSRRNRPKQFIDFFGVGRSLLQLTYDRFVQFIPADHVFVTTYEDYADQVREQLPDLPPQNILSEPVQLSTAPAAAWASFKIMQDDSEANIVVSPADQFITGEECFAREIQHALDVVSREPIFLAVGIKASEPRTTYGYIQCGKAREDEQLFEVKTFTEKPTLDFAQMFVDSGEFLWNTGLFLWNVRTMRERFSDLAPELESLGVDFSQRLADTEFKTLFNKHYPSAQHGAIDLLILERCPNVCVTACSFGWSDVGCWPQMSEVLHKDTDNNVIAGTGEGISFVGCRDTLVALPDGMGAVLKGLEGYLVALNNNMLVITPNNDPAFLRSKASEIQIQLGDEFV